MSIFGFRDEPHMRSILGDEISDGILGAKRSSKTLRVCRRDRGESAGSMPFIIDGKSVWGFVYWLEEPHLRVVDGKIIRNVTTDYDPGVDLISHTVVFRGDTYSWSEIIE